MGTLCEPDETNFYPELSKAAVDDYQEKVNAADKRIMIIFKTLNSVVVKKKTILTFLYLTCIIIILGF